MTTTKTEAKTQAETPLCACGCGEHVQRQQAKFVRGHDSRLVRQLKERHLAGELTRAQAVKEAAKVSPVLGKKLGRFIDSAVAKQKAERDAAKAKGNGKAAATPRATRKPKAQPPEDEPGPGDPVREEAAEAAKEE
ncbi:MAG: hypothetical protein ACM32E_09900 [Gemmatimonadota bacterium]